MSFGFGKNSGPTAPPPTGQTPFGHFPRSPPAPSTSPFVDLPAAPQFPRPRTFNTYSRARASSFLDDARLASGSSHAAPSRRSLSPPKSRSGMGVIRTPDLQYNQRPSPIADGVNGNTYATRSGSHSVPKRTRSPPAAGPIFQTDSSEDGAEREQEAKAKRLARFKAELDEGESSDSIQYSRNVSKTRVSSMKTDRSSMEKQKFSSVDPSGVMEDQDFDNEGLQSNSVIVGLCLDMCPESERAERERKGDLDQYERLDGDRNQTSKTLAVKKYTRTAEREAELIRPMPILQKTMDYLLGLLDQPYDDRFLGLYNFLWDRMRAVRMDLRMQHIFDHRAITMLEQMIRLHIIAMHELCEFSKGEGFSEGFDAHLNIEQMNKTSVELFQLYEDHRKRGIFIPTEKEFRGYYALLKLDKHPGYRVEPSELSLDLAKMTAEMRQTQEVLFARDVARSCRTGNFIAFFRQARRASYHQACLMHAHFSKLRTQALASLHSGLQYNQGLPVAHVAKWLGMEGEDIESLLEYHGFLMKEFEEPYMVKEGPFLNDEKDYSTRCSILVHRKRSDTIVEDVLSSHQEMLFPSEFRKEIQSENNKNKHAAVQPIQTASPIVSDDGVMDMEDASSPSRSMQDLPVVGTSRNMQVQPVHETSRIGQPFTDNHHKVSAGSPGSIIKVSKDFANVQSQGMQQQPSPMTPKDGSLNADASQLSFKSSPWNFSAEQFVSAAKTSCFGLAGQDSFGGPTKGPPEIVVHSELKAAQAEVPSGNIGKWIPPASEADSGIPSSLQDNASMEDVTRKEFTDVQQEVENDDSAISYDEEVAEAKLRLLLRLWRRRFVRQKKFREQNRLAADAALSSLSLGPPIRQNIDKPTPCRTLNIDQAVNGRYGMRQQSLARWNVSDLVAGKLVGKNADLNCICWKVISFSWLHHVSGDVKSSSPQTHLSLNEWLHYKLFPSKKDETVEGLVMSVPGLSVWRKWAPNHSGDFTCYFSVIKDTGSGNSEKGLVGASAVLFPISETVSWDLQRVELHSLVMSLPTGSCIPLLIISGSGEDNYAEFCFSIVDKLGLKDLDKSRVGSFLVTCLNERQDNGQFHGYFSDQKLKEGLTWLASESPPQPVVCCVTMHELVFRHLHSCLDAFYHIGSDKIGPNQCISAFNEALDQSLSDIITAANTNPTGWPCPELFLLDDSTAEFRVMKQFLPSLGWSSSEELEPLISTLRNCKLPSFSDDVSWLNIGCNTENDIEDRQQLLQDCLIRYLTQTSNMMNLMMATKEASVMVQNCTRLELQNTEYKVLPNWVLIFRRVSNWQLNSSSNFTSKVYILEKSHSTCTTQFPEKPELDQIPTPHYIVHPSLDEMVEVSCGPIVSKRVRSSPKSFQNVAAITSSENTVRVAPSNYLVEEKNQCRQVHVQSVDDSDFHLRKNDQLLVSKDETAADTLSKLLDRCSMLQDEIDKTLSVYF